MKMMVKMAVLVLLATLLLLTGVALAGGSNCQCYEVTCTNLDNDSTITHNVEFCLGPWNEPPDGQFNGLCGEKGEMSLFFDSMKLQAIITSKSPVDASLKFHGDYYHVVTGIVNCYGSRWSIRGQATDEGECDTNGG